MTFNNAAWAIDGATLNSALARTQAYAACSGSEGIVSKGDLKVRPLATPGNGLIIGAGSALVLNRYQTTPNQIYTAVNPGDHTISSGSMPATNPSVAYYILALVIGDPEAGPSSQAGHPFMLGTDPPAGTASTFLYVRPMLIPCSSTATSLGAITYPAIPLARIAIPANLGAITSAQITDLRSLARPRTQLVQGFAQTSSGSKSITTSYQRFPDANAIVSVPIPSWAVKAKVMGFIEGLKLTAAGTAQIQPYMTTGDGRATSEITNVSERAPGAANERRSYNVGGIFDVSDLGGTTQSFAVQAKCNSGNAGFLTTDAAGSMFLQIYFEEVPV